MARKGESHGQAEDRIGTVRARQRTAEAAGYSCVEEFIAACVEKEVARMKVKEEDAHVTNQLRGLGYIE